MSSVRPMQRMRGPVRPHGHGLVRTSTWSRVRKRRSGAARCRRCVRTSSPARAVVQRQRGARLRVDQLRVDEAARAEVHPVLLLALAPERDADVADAHRLGDPARPSPPRAARGRPARRRPARPRRGRARRSSRARSTRARRGAPRRTASARPPRAAAARSRASSRSVFPVPTGMWMRPMRSNGAERGAGDERPGVVGRDDPLAGRDPRGRVAARRAGHPVVEVAGGERDVARRAGRAARRVDADDLGRVARRGARRTGSRA